MKIGILGGGAFSLHITLVCSPLALVDALENSALPLPRVS